MNFRDMRPLRFYRRLLKTFNLVFDGDRDMIKGCKEEASEDFLSAEINRKGRNLRKTKI